MRCFFARSLRLTAVSAALLATFALVGGGLLKHEHALDETDLVAHAIAEPAAPHANTPHQPLHLEAGRDAEHAACVDCLLSALSPAFASASAAFAVPLPRFAPAATLPESAPLASTFEAASPRGPPSAA